MKIPAGLSLVLALSLLAASPAAAQVCGDYVRDAGEQCDDGNTRNLDGCDSACQFEQVHRVVDLKLQNTVDATLCTTNAFGGAFTNLGLNATNAGIAAGVQSGATSILLQFLGLDDLSGTSDASVNVGVLSGAPILPGAGAYNGTADADWWHAVDPTMIDAQKLPLNQLGGDFTGSMLTAGPGDARIKLLLSGGVATFSLSSMRLSLPVAASTTPASSVGAVPPGHLAVEHLDPALQSFGTSGAGTPPAGKLCGNVSALSLAQTPVPPGLLAGAGACRVGLALAYTAANSLLDVFIGGCNVSGLPAVQPTQPDTTDASAPAAGAGPPYTLSANATTKIVDTCRDNTATPVDLTTCLTHAAYSVWFRFASNRVIAGDNRVFADSFESGDMSAWSATQTDGGDLTVDPTAAMAGTTQGLLGDVNDTTSLFVQDALPTDENRIRARFYIDPTGFDPGEPVHRRTRVMLLLEDGPTRRVAAVVLRRLNGQYAIMGRARLDSGLQADTGFFDITAAPHRVEVDWLRSSGPDADDGRFVLSIDGVAVSTLSGLDNSISSVDTMRLGGLSLKGTTNGALKWDHVEWNRMSATTP